MPNNLLNSSGVTRLSHDAKQYANSRFRELTYAEYDALSQAEKMNGTWYFVREEIINKPVMTIDDVSYTGSAVSPTFTGYDSTTMSITGNTATEIGTYVAKISPLRGYCWPDRTQTQETYTWTISQATSILTVPEQNGTLTYDTTQQSPTWDSHYDSTKMTVTGDTGTNAGEYTATFSLIDKTNTQWSDGTTTDKTSTWTITPKTITFEGLSNKDKTYSGSSQSPTVPTYDSNEVTVGGDTSGINAGDYITTFTLTNTTNYKWDDNTTAAKSDTWTIAKATFTATVSIDGYAYAGTKSTPSISANPGGGTVTYYASATSGGTATEWSQVTATTYDAGTRYCYALINATENYEGCITAPTAYTITKGTLNATVSISGYTYAGTKSTPTISGNTGGGTVTYYGRSTSTGTGTAWTSVSSTTYDAGTRYCYATIAETTNFQAYTTPNTSFTIAKASFTATVSISGYTYAGTKSTPTVSNNPGNASVTYYGRSTSTGSGTVWSNVTSTTYNAGTRYCYAVIAESTNYNSYTTQNTSFTIAKASFTATVSISGYTYGGTKSTPSVSNNPGNASVTYYGRNTSSGTATNWNSVTSTTYDVGNRYIYAVIAESTNYNSYTTANTVFSISKGSFTATLSVPNYTYGGTVSTPTVSSNPGNASVQYYGRATSGASATSWQYVTSTTYNAGTHYAYAYINSTNNYNGYTTSEVSFQVLQAQGAFTLSKNSVSLDTTTTSDTVTATVTGDGTISAVSSDTSVATVSVSGNTITITGVDSGSTTITVSLSGTTNYSAPSSKTISVTADMGVEIVSWASGTDAQIAAMIKAADEGKIDLYADGGWRVGDVRQVPMSSISYSGTYDGVSWNVGKNYSMGSGTLELVLLDAGQTSATPSSYSSNAATSYQLVNSVKNKNGTNRNNPAFLVGSKKVLETGTSGYMNINSSGSGAGNSGSWNSCQRRNWCNGGFRGALPETLRPIFKQFKSVTATNTYSDNTQQSNDYFSLAAAKEIVGDNVYATSGENSALKQFEYYKTSANRIKQRTSSTSTWQYYTRSPHISATDWCYISTDGNVTSGDLSIGYAPFGAI